jgi:hypothetical protein
MPDKYSQFGNVFDKTSMDVLPPHGAYDCRIDIEPGQHPPFSPIYPLSEPESQAFSDLIAENLAKRFITENLAKRFITESASPAGAAMLFVKKKDGSLRMCIHYRGLNAMTIRNRYPFPLVNELLDRLRSAKIFIRIDLRSVKMNSKPSSTRPATEGTKGVGEPRPKGDQAQPTQRSHRKATRH